MNYTFLIKGGKICSFQPTATASWGKKEQPPAFQYHIVDTDLPTAKVILQDCKYLEEGFVYKETNEVLDLETVIKLETDFDTDGKDKNKKRAKKAKGQDVNNPLEVLKPEHRNDELDTRRFWFRTMFEHRQDPKVRSLLEAVKYGCYGHIFERVENLDTSVREQILESVDEADRDWVRYCLGGTQQ